MTQKIRDKTVDIEENQFNCFCDKCNWSEVDVKWLCNTIEKLCDVVDRAEDAFDLEGYCGDDYNDAYSALIKWEDKL